MILKQYHIKTMAVMGSFQNEYHGHNNGGIRLEESTPAFVCF